MVQIPMPNDAAQPVGLFLAARSHQEAADRSLTTFVVAVQQVNDDPSTGGNRLADHLPVGVARIAYDEVSADGRVLSRCLYGSS